MKNAEYIILHLPIELKNRLQQEAKNRGVSLNHLANDLMAAQLTWLESAALEKRLEKQSLPDLKQKVKEMLDKIPERDVPPWDRIDS